MLVRIVVIWHNSPAGVLLFPGFHEPEFIRAVANLRSKFNRLINAAAVVVYGLPEVEVEEVSIDP